MWPCFVPQQECPAAGLEARSKGQLPWGQGLLWGLGLGLGRAGLEFQVLGLRPGLIYSLRSEGLMPGPAPCNPVPREAGPVLLGRALERR